MTTTKQRAVRSVIAVVAALAVAPVQASAAPAQVAEPVVTITATQGDATFATDCKGQSKVEIRAAIQLTITRSGDTASEITVGLDLGGSLASSSGLPATATIGAGETQVVLTAAEAASGNLYVNLIDGDGYAVGSPNSVSTGVGAVIADLGCNIGSPYAEQTIEVGTTPAPFDVETIAYGPGGSLNREISGEVPTGTTFHLDGTFTGTAAEVGDWYFRMYFCQDDGWCPYRADLRVIVVPAGEDPPSGGEPAPEPATPATAVAGTPVLTG